MIISWKMDIKYVFQNKSERILFTLKYIHPFIPRWKQIAYIYSLSPLSSPKRIFWWLLRKTTEPPGLWIIPGHTASYHPSTDCIFTGMKPQKHFPTREQPLHTTKLDSIHSSVVVVVHITRNRSTLLQKVSSLLSSVGHHTMYKAHPTGCNDKMGARGGVTPIPTCLHRFSAFGHHPFASATQRYI